MWMVILTTIATTPSCHTEYISSCITLQYVTLCIYHAFKVACSHCRGTQSSDLFTAAANQRKYLVCDSNLMELLQVCRHCAGNAKVNIKRLEGTLLDVEQVRKKMQWNSFILCTDSLWIIKETNFQYTEITLNSHLFSKYRFAMIAYGPNHGKISQPSTRCQCLTWYWQHRFC